MRYALNTTKAIAQAFFKTANPDDEFLMLTVSTLPDSASVFTRDTQALQQNIQSTTSGGMTALLDTVYLGRPHRAVLILSDGMDNEAAIQRSARVPFMPSMDCEAGAGGGGTPGYSDARRAFR
jgi:hypothetical protein